MILSGGNSGVRYRTQLLQFVISGCIHYIRLNVSQIVEFIYILAFMVHGVGGCLCSWEQDVICISPSG